MATLYFNAAIDNDWNTLGNWWLDNTLTTPATNLPTSADSVIALATISSNSGSAPTVVNFTLEDINNELDIGITVTGIATFNGNAKIGMNGSVVGNCIFNNIANDRSTCPGFIIEGIMPMYAYTKNLRFATFLCGFKIFFRG